MREIKFRGFSETQNRWLIGHYSIYDQRVHRIHFVDDCGFHKDCAVDGESIGQYTGLKDKNGVEIYEGDIFVNSLDEIYTVCYARHMCGLVARYGKAAKEYTNLYVLVNLDSIKVIGNKYQNPELLERDNEQS